MLFGEGRDEVAVAERASAANRGLVPAFERLERIQQGVNLRLQVALLAVVVDNGVGGALGFSGQADRPVAPMA